jgi:hypothetical protein
MPFADKERRKEYQRLYKARWRRRARKIGPLAGFRIFFCQKYPNLHIGAGGFLDGFLVTNDPEAIDKVRRHPGFGEYIFPLALDLDCTPIGEEGEWF